MLGADSGLFIEDSVRNGQFKEFYVFACFLTYGKGNIFSMGQKAQKVHDESPRIPVLLPLEAIPKAIIVLDVWGNLQEYL